MLATAQWHRKEFRSGALNYIKTVFVICKSTDVTSLIQRENRHAKPASNHSLIQVIYEQQADLETLHRAFYAFC